MHVLPYDLPRGAQRYARAMRLLLDGRGAEHRTLCMFGSQVGALDADIKLSIDKTRLGRLGIEPRALWALRATIASLKPAVLVAHGSEPLKYLAALPAARPLVYYKIGIAHAGAHRRFRRAFHAALLSRASVVAGVSQECLDEAHTVFGVARDRLALIPNGRDPDLFWPAPKQNAVPVVTFVGHLSASKRPELFIEVIRRLRAEGTQLHAWVIGDGPLLASCEALAARADVQLLGRRDDVAQLLRESDVFVFTSIPDGEGMPGVFIEAGLSGLPVVATDVPGASTVMRDGVTGYVVPVDAIEMLVQRVRQLVVDSSLREQLGQAARERCRSGFSLEASVSRWQALLSKL